MSHSDILEIPISTPDVDAATVGEYLACLLIELWRECEGFSSKRPFGNSGWEWTVYEAAARAGIVEALPDEFGEIDLTPNQTAWIDELLVGEIRRVFGVSS